MAKHKPFNFQSSIRTGNTGSHTGKSPQTAIASTTSSAAGHPAALAFSPSMRDALYFSSKRQQPMLTPDAVRKIFGPAQTLGAPKEVRMAMDNALEQAGFYSLLQHGLDMGVYGGMANFLGYAALQNIAQNGLIRACIETVSDDMTRNWIEVTRDSEDNADDNSEGKDEAIDAINAEIEKLELQKVMHEACSMTGYYGGCLLYLDTGASGDFLKHPLNLDPLFSMEAKDKGFLKAVRCLDPINVFPGTYNATNPLADDYYRPHTWWVLGKEVHASRLIRIVANEAPLIFKPSYNFLGIPQAQILWDYVLHFQQNRDAANRLLNKFSMLVFKTAMADIITNEGGLDQLDARMMLLARNQSNDGVFAIDRENEDVVKVETPLSGVTDIVKQSLEQLAAMNRTPAVKLLGISPSGFNATGESDLRNYYDHVLSQQEKVLRHAIKDILDVMQISLFGEVDNSISFSFRPLSEDDKNAVAMTQQVKANTLCSLLDRDIISPEEARRVLIADPASGLNDLDPDEVPEPKDEQGMGGMPGMPGMGGEKPEQTPEGQVSEESDEVSLGRQLLGMDAEPEGEVVGFFNSNGADIPIHAGQSKNQAFENFIKKKREATPSSEGTKGIKKPIGHIYSQLDNLAKKYGFSTKDGGLWKDDTEILNKYTYNMLLDDVYSDQHIFTEWLEEVDAGKREADEITKNNVKYYLELKDNLKQAKEDIDKSIENSVMDLDSAIDAYMNIDEDNDKDNYMKKVVEKHLKDKIIGQLVYSEIMTEENIRAALAKLEKQPEKTEDFRKALTNVFLSGRYIPKGMDPEEFKKQTIFDKSINSGNRLYSYLNGDEYAEFEHVKDKAQFLKKISEERLKKIPKTTLKEVEKTDSYEIMHKILSDREKYPLPGNLNKESLMQYLCQQLEMNEKPTLVSKKEFDKLSKEKDSIVIYRGEHENFNIKPYDFIHDMKYGEQTFLGDGAHGDGLYFTTRQDEAQRIYGSHNPFNVARAIIDFKKAKIFTQEKNGDTTLTALKNGCNVLRIGDDPRDAHYVVLDRSVLIMEED